MKCIFITPIKAHDMWGRVIKTSRIIILTIQTTTGSRMYNVSNCFQQEIHFLKSAGSTVIPSKKIREKDVYEVIPYSQFKDQEFCQQFA